MSKVILFSQLTESVMNQIRDNIFNPSDLEKEVIFIPSNGLSSFKYKYRDFWNEEARKNGFRVNFLDLESEDTQSLKNSVINAKTIIVSGGNTFLLLQLLRKSGLDVTIREFLRSENKRYVGFSAGAIILSPTINAATFERVSGADEKIVGLTDLTSIGAINFDIIPHFNPEVDNEVLEEYKNTNNIEVRTLTDEEFLILDILGIINPSRKVIYFCYKVRNLNH